MIVADTDVLIDALRGREPWRTRVAEELRRRRLATTSVTVFELLSGARDDEQRGKIVRLLAALTVLPFDEPASVAAAETRRALEAAGAAIGMADYLIAGVCLSRSARLWTRNRRHFGRIPGLAIDEAT